MANIKEIRQHGRSAVTQEGRHDSGKRQHAQRSAGDQQDLQGHGHAQARGQEEFVIAARAQGDARRAIQDERVEREHRGHAQEAPLLAQRRKDQVGVRGRHQRRIAQARSRAPEAARGIGPQRLRQLIAAVDDVVPRRRPHGDALVNGVGDAHE
jgi:hypothetical protein